MCSDTDVFTDFSISDLTSDYQVEFYRYWHKKRGARRLPARSDIDPAEIIKILPFITLLERSSEDYLYRLVGTQCAALLGEKTGKKVSDRELGSRGVKRLDWCAENLKPYFLIRDLNFMKKRYPTSSALVMPLSDNAKDVNMIILAYDFY